MWQMNLFDGATPFKITKPIRLIELFAGYGSQALALKYLGVPFEHHHICEWAVKSIQAYKDLHFSTDKTDYAATLNKQQVFDALFNFGISADYNKPMPMAQITRLGEEKARQIYNNICATRNLGSICNTTADKLGITETNKYCYIMTYSFPCQDLSSGGKCAGMGKGSGTRSGLLWEVERLLTECKELPQVLVMENVTEILNAKNINHFAMWLKFLDSLGYKSKWQNFNATEFNMPQHRNRCFMVSVLGDWYFAFPQPQIRTKTLIEMLERKVQPAYYLTNNEIKHLNEHKERQKAKGNNFGWQPVNPNDKGAVARTITTKEGNRQASTFIEDAAAPGGKRYRTLTERECFRLMGVKDEDYDRIAQNQSSSSLYHLAGDSIVTNVLMAIFSQML